MTELAQDIRKFLNDFVNKNNGHIGSNLGVTERPLKIMCMDCNNIFEKIK
ncbi:1-deoxy-D-xylulose-5-phosphate synthase N-terminal domain-containing protein [Spiroplasma endosymbiont of Atherix ibis]